MFNSLTHTPYVYQTRDEKGSITIFVIIAMIFFIILLITMFVMTKNKETAMAKEIDQIKANYAVEASMDEVYTTIADEKDKYVTQGMIEELIEQKMNEKVLSIYQ